MIYIIGFFSSKCSLFHNFNVFDSCFIHILYTGCAKIKKKFRRQKVKKFWQTAKSLKLLGRKARTLDTCVCVCLCVCVCKRERLITRKILT